jgi:hypothetical protein
VTATQRDESPGEAARTLHVSPSFGDDATFNTVVLTGVDLELPLEADLDGDPLHDDEVALEGVDGSRRILRVGDPDVRLDPARRLYLYRFRDVPCGIYTLLVQLSDGGWAPIASGLLVTKAGASLGGAALAGDEAPAIPEEPPRDDPDVAAEDLVDEHSGDFIDQPYDLGARRS